jgi:hypothetical protein
MYACNASLRIKPKDRIRSKYRTFVYSTYDHLMAPFVYYCVPTCHCVFGYCTIRASHISISVPRTYTILLHTMLHVYITPNEARCDSPPTPWLYVDQEYYSADPPPSILCACIATCNTSRPMRLNVIVPQPHGCTRTRNTVQQTLHHQLFCCTTDAVPFALCTAQLCTPPVHPSTAPSTS